MSQTCEAFQASSWRCPVTSCNFVYNTSHTHAQLRLHIHSHPAHQPQILASIKAAWPEHIVCPWSPCRFCNLIPPRLSKHALHCPPAPRSRSHSSPPSPYPPTPSSPSLSSSPSSRSAS